MLRMLHGCAGFDFDKSADLVVVFVLVERDFVDPSCGRSTCRSWLRLALAAVLAWVLVLGLELLVTPSATRFAAADNCNCNCACECECNVNSAAMRSIRTPFVPDDWMPVARAMRCNCADFKHASQGCVGEYSAAERRIGEFVCACCLPGLALGGVDWASGASTGTSTSTTNLGFPCLACGRPVTAILGWMHGAFWDDWILQGGWMPIGARTL